MEEARRAFSDPKIDFFSHRRLNDGVRYLKIDQGHVFLCRIDDPAVSFLIDGLDTSGMRNEIIDQTPDGRYVLFRYGERERRILSIVDTQDKKKIALPTFLNADTQFGGQAGTIVTILHDERIGFEIRSYLEGPRVMSKTVNLENDDVNLTGKFACYRTLIVYQYKKKHLFYGIGLLDLADDSRRELFEYASDTEALGIEFATPSTLVLSLKKKYIVYDLYSKTKHEEVFGGGTQVIGFTPCVSPDGRLLLMSYFMLGHWSNYDHFVRPLIINKEAQTAIENSTTFGPNDPVLYTEKTFEKMAVQDYGQTPLLRIKTTPGTSGPAAHALAPLGKGLFIRALQSAFIAFAAPLTYPIFTFHYAGGWMRVMSNYTLETHDTHPGVFFEGPKEETLRAAQLELTRRGVNRDALNSAIAMWFNRDGADETLEDAQVTHLVRITNAIALAVGVF